MEIFIKTIPHSEQRYPTCGDYWYDENGVLQIRVSDMGNSKYEAMVIIHELIEQKLTEWKGLKEQEITDFDIEFEGKRQYGNLDEPGFAENCPYLAEHTFATSVELGMCAMAGISFMEYDKVVNSL